MEIIYICHNCFSFRFSHHFLAELHLLFISDGIQSLFHTIYCMNFPCAAHTQAHTQSECKSTAEGCARITHSIYSGYLDFVSVFKLDFTGIIDHIVTLASPSSSTLLHFHSKIKIDAKKCHHSFHSNLNNNVID